MEDLVRSASITSSLCLREGTDGSDDVELAGPASEGGQLASVEGDAGAE